MTEVYLKEMEIRNFRTHKHSVIPFNRGVNGFIGTSSSGKSNIIRALIWNILNEPSGTEYIMKDDEAKEASVTTRWSNGYAIERRKNKSGTKNFYALYKDGELVNEYTGFGTGVPPEIVEAHGIKPLSSGVFFNYADQLESAFMISGTPKARAETIGNLEELGRIDEELSKVNEDIRFDRKYQKELNDDIAAKEKEIEALKEKMEHQGHKVSTLRMLSSSVEEYEKSSRTVEHLRDRLETIKKEAVQHEEVVSRANRILTEWNNETEEQIDTVRKASTSLKRLIDIREELSNLHFMNSDNLEHLEGLVSRADKAVSVFQQLSRIRSRMEKIEEEKEAATNYSTRAAQLDMSGIDRDVEKYRFLIKKSKRVKEIEEESKQYESEVSESLSRIDELLSQFVEALQQEEVCPTCSQSTDELSKEDIEKVIN